MLLQIGEIADKIPIIHPTTKCSYVYNLFEKSPEIEGVIIADQDKPMGLVMRIHFYQSLSKRYGLDLFMGRHIKLIMDKMPLYIDYNVDIVEASTLAMQRSEQHIYDSVIVTVDGKVHGIVSIKNLLLKLAEIKVDIARDLSPLTGLPGNYEIQQHLEKVLTFEEFSILYLDLDQFKSYNDTYGFHKGDELLRETSVLIKTNTNHLTTPYFIGHIGGDDFIIILTNHLYSSICEQIIQNFDLMLERFYQPEDYKKGYIHAQNRQGNYEDISLVGMSIAVITNKNSMFSSIDEISREAAKVKKICKKGATSCYRTNEIQYSHQQLNSFN